MFPVSASLHVCTCCVCVHARAHPPVSVFTHTLLRSVGMLSGKLEYGQICPKSQEFSRLAVAVGRD